MTAQRPSDAELAGLIERLIDAATWCPPDRRKGNLFDDAHAAVASLRDEKEVSIYKRCVLFACPDSEHYHKEEP